MSGSASQSSLAASVQRVPRWAWIAAAGTATVAAATAVTLLIKHKQKTITSSNAKQIRTQTEDSNDTADAQTPAASPEAAAASPATSAASPMSPVTPVTPSHPDFRMADPTSSTDPDPQTVLIGTRSSQLALWQAHHVRDTLQARFPHIEFKVVPMNTMGDIDQIKPLSDFASKGVFTKELDVATLMNHIQLAVHCVKDLPTTLPPGLFMGAILERGDLEDVLVLPISHKKYQHGSLDDLPDGAVIGTSAMRRSASIAKYYPKLVCKNIRGNVNTRLMKLDRGDFDAIILARAGLSRLGLANRITQVLDVKKYGYAVGQGALAIVCRENDAVTQRLVASMEDVVTRWSCEAERGVLRTLNGGCKVPITIRSTIDQPSRRYLEEHPDTTAPAAAPAAAGSSARSRRNSLSSENGLARELHVWCSVMSLDGRVEIHATHHRVLDARKGVAGAGGPQAQQAARQLGEELGQMLLKKGADKLLEGIIDPQGTGLAPPTQQNKASSPGL